LLRRIKQDGASLCEQSEIKTWSKTKKSIDTRQYRMSQINSFSYHFQKTEIEIFIL